MQVDLRAMYSTTLHAAADLNTLHIAADLNTLCSVTLLSQTKTPAAATTAFVIVAITQTKCDLHECKVSTKFHYEIARRTNIMLVLYAIS